MSRSCAAAVSGHVRFPRVSGDEPLTVLEPVRKTMFSPRERG